MLAKSSLALATQAGQVVVDAAVGDEWETAERGYARLLGRGDALQTRLAEQRLHETRDQLMGAAGTDVGLIRKALAVGWAGRLADLLEEYPSAEADLRTLVRQVQAVTDPVTPVVPPQAAKLPVPPPGAPSGSSRAASGNGDAGGDATIVIRGAQAPEQPASLAKQSEFAYSIGRDKDAAAARDQFAELLLVRQRILGPEHAETLAIWYQLAYWTALAADSAAARE